MYHISCINAKKCPPVEKASLNNSRLPLTKITGLAHLEDVHLGFLFNSE